MNSVTLSSDYRNISFTFIRDEIISINVLSLCSKFRIYTIITELRIPVHGTLIILISLEKGNGTSLTVNPVYFIICRETVSFMCYETT